MALGQLLPRVFERLRLTAGEACGPRAKGRALVSDAQCHEQRGVRLQGRLFLAELLECRAQVGARPAAKPLPGARQQALLECNDAFEVDVVGRKPAIVAIARIDQAVLPQLVRAQHEQIRRKRRQRLIRRVSMTGRP